MKITELMNIAQEIKQTVDEERVNRQLSFVEESHEYSIYDPINEQMVSDLPSVSTLLKNWYEPFDSVTKSLQMMDGDVKLAADLRDQWKKAGDDASSIGSYAHYKLEQYVWSLFDIHKETRKPEYSLKDNELIEAQEMIRNGVNMIHRITSKGFVPIDTECVMGSIELGYFGQCDNLWLGEHKNKLVFLMTDHKTNKTKNFREAPFNIPMKPPFNKMLDTALSKYFVQQPLYAQLFKDMLKNTPYKDIPFAGFRIIHLRDDGDIIKIPTWVYDEVKKLYPVGDE